MIFFDNCCSKLWSTRCLSIRWLFGRCLRPPTLLILLLFLSSAAFGMKVTLNLKSVSLETAFAEIKKQSGYGFWYEKKDLEGLPKVSLELKNADLVTALETCLKGQPLSYQVFDKTVVVKRKAAAPVTLPLKKLSQDQIKGKVVDAQTKEPLAGVLVKVKVPAMSVVTDDKGMFELTLPVGKYDLTVQYLGYSIHELSLTLPLTEDLTVSLVSEEETLNAVEVVSTGYQTLPKERATGSFVVVDAALLNRGVGTNILDRLNGVTSSLIFNKNTNAVGFNESSISVRGRSTILGDPNPLIVLDNFPYEGDLGSINPNDIASVTVLRDAAAASIWGTKAGNGVIVITTRSGKFNQKAKVSFSQNMSIGQKPKLLSQPQLSSKEYLEVEQYLFDRGRYDATINNGYGSLSPGVEIMLLYRQQKIDLARRNQMLDSLSNYRAFDEYLDAFYRMPINQQYQLDVSGGGSSHKYYISGGFDRNLESRNVDKLSRMTLNMNNTYGMFDGKFTLGIGLQLTNTLTRTGQTISPKFPYEHIRDENVGALPVTDGVLGLRYVSNAESLGLQDWYFRPLNENRTNNEVNRLTVRINNSFSAVLTKQLKLSGNYMYQLGNTEDLKTFARDSYYTRNLINTYSSRNLLTNQILRPFILGDIFTPYEAKSRSNYGRMQLSFDNGNLSDHQLNALLGAEISDNQNYYRANTLYGYDPDLGTNGNQGIDFSRDYINIYSGGTGRISTGQVNGRTVDRYLSFYGNASYTYLGKYTLSASARKDEANIFGVKSNQKGVPLWSVGTSWLMSKEQFMKKSFLDLLRIRATYGFNGNADRSTSAYLTASPSSTNNRWGVVQTTITNPPNPSLTWEKVRNINVGLEAHFLKSRIKFNGEIYRKDGMDLIGLSPIAPQTGVSTYRGNSANLRTQGLDLTVNVQVLNGDLKWNSNVLLSMVKDKVMEFRVQPGTNYDIVGGNYRNPLVGYPYNAQFSFRYGGLDNTGSPKGYLGITESNNYTAIRNSSDREGLIYHGSGTPTAFGSILNSFNWKGLTFSFNIVYKAGYWLRRNSLDNITLFNGAFLMPDYHKRWKTVGDEQFTNVPSLTYPVVGNRAALYNFSEVLMIKGDHLRLQDIRLDFDLRSILLKKMPMEKLVFFVHAGNLGLIWKANKDNIDPDSPNIGQTSTISYGFRGTF